MRSTREAYWRWRASFPHDPMWNLIPRRRQPGGAWECSWHGTVRLATCAECHREHAEYLERGTWSAPLTEWSVSAGGYRLVIEGGEIIGLASGENPWPWGDPRWLVDHLIADHEIRSLLFQPLHECDDRCACPRHGTPLFYSHRTDEHACLDADCPYGHGIRAAIGAVLPPRPGG